MDNADRVTGWWIFAGILLTIAGVLNIIWGIAAIAESHFFTATGAHYVFSNLKTWGWITLILGVLELFAGFSLFAGGSYGRWFGMIAAGLRRDRVTTGYQGPALLVNMRVRAIGDRDLRARQGPGIVGDRRASSTRL